MTSTQARAAALVRVATGLLFVAEGWSKIVGPFVRGGFEKSARHMATEGWPFWAGFLSRVVIPNAGAFAWVVALSELALGVGLVLGLLTRVAGACGALLMLTILLGQSYAPGAPWTGWITAGLETKFALLLLALLAVVDAGRTWGLDGRVGRRGRRVPGVRR